MKKMLWLVWLLGVTLLGAQPVSIASYNLGNYLSCDRMVNSVWRSDYPKPEVEKAALFEVIKAAQADVLVVQEIGTQLYFEEFQKRLKLVGLDYPYAAHMATQGARRCLAIFSKFPFDEVEYADVHFSQDGQDRFVLRGMLEARFRTLAGTPWSLFGIHLKSRHTSDATDPLSEERRVREASALRNIIDKAVDGGELTNYIVAGDFNDTARSRALRRFLKKGEQVLSVPLKPVDSRGEVWTQFWGPEGVYSRFDYLLVSPSLLPTVVRERTRIVDIAEATVASDHRLVRMTFDPDMLVPPEDSAVVAPPVTIANPAPAVASKPVEIHSWAVWSVLLGIALGPLVGIPVAPMYIAVGALLGLWGLPLVGLVLLFNLSVSYWLGAGPARWVVQRFVKTARLPSVESLGVYRFIVLVRIMPGLPLSLQNYLLGFMRVGSSRNLWVGWPIQMLWAAGFIGLGKSFMSSAWISFALLAVAILILSTLLKNYARKLKQRTQREDL